ncbi:hypothetical protein [Streptomyces mirabilis]
MATYEVARMTARQAPVLASLDRFPQFVRDALVLRLEGLAARRDR